MHIGEDGHEYVDLRPESSIPRWVGVVAVLTLLVVVVVGGAWHWYGQQLDPSGGPGETISVTVPSGSSLSDISSILDAAGVIPNATIFDYHANRKSAGPFQAGVYRLQRNSDVDLVLEKLEAGPSAPLARAATKVTIPEGFTVDQIVARIHAKVPRLAEAELQGLLDQGKVPTSLKPSGTTSYEGLLFPATYEIAEDDTSVEVLTRMAAEMESRVSSLGIDAARAHIQRRWGLDLSAYDMVKVASMIQFEAAIPEDAPKIAAVTYNRLDKGIPLGIDSTSVYEAELQGKAEPDYEADSPYNTRTRTGLPPTPIAAPGEFALEGAMEPADGPWLYFVLTDANEITFTESYDDFLAAKALCKQRDLGCG